MDQLPVEIISLIADCLQHWDISTQPFSHLTETSEGGHVGWLIHTTESCRATCNFRLVCRDLYNSSLRNFGQVLGDRTFRITKADLESLQVLSGVAALRPYIRTLTFGNAQFDSNLVNETLEAVLAEIPAPHQARLRAAYRMAYDWQHNHVQLSFVQPMKLVLRQLSNLENVRLLTSDHPRGNSHLRGWLDPGDDEIVAKAWLGLAGDLDNCCSIYDTYRSRQVAGRRQEHQTAVGFFPLCDALNAAGSSIRDLRIGLKNAVVPLALFTYMQDTGMHSTLRSLRLQIDPRFFRLPGQQVSVLHYERIFALIPNVVDLSLSLVHAAQFWDFASAASYLLKLLRLVPRLQQLTLRGNWAYAEQDLVEFIICQAGHLSKLVLKGPVLSIGDWTSLVHRLVTMNSSVLRHMHLSDMSTMEPNTRIVPAFDATTWQGLIEKVQPMIQDHARYTVYLSSGDCTYIYCPSQT